MFSFCFVLTLQTISTLSLLCLIVATMIVTTHNNQTSDVPQHKRKLVSNSEFLKVLIKIVCPRDLVKLIKLTIRLLPTSQLSNIFQTNNFVVNIILNGIFVVNLTSHCSNVQF